MPVALAADRNQLGLDSRHRQTDGRRELARPRPTDGHRRGLGRAEARHEDQPLAARLDRDPLQLVGDVLREAGGGVEENLHAAEEPGGQRRVAAEAPAPVLRSLSARSGRPSAPPRAGCGRSRRSRRQRGALRRGRATRRCRPRCRRCGCRRRCDARAASRRAPAARRRERAASAGSSAGCCRSCGGC